MLATEAVSLLAFVFPVVRMPVLVLVAIMTLWLSVKNLEWGIYVLFGELFFGSRGHLFSFDLGPVTVSLRLVVFVAVFLGWLWQMRDWSGAVQKFRRIPLIYWLLFVVVAAGAAHGMWARHGLGNVFGDVNAYLYLAILPAVLWGVKSRQSVENLLRILAAAVVVIAFKTLTLFVWFSFGLPGVATLYHWVIEQDIGEITGQVGSASRIFMQSQFYSLVGLFIFGLSRKKNWWIVGLAALAVILSLSRSFWLGVAAAAVFAFFLLWLYYHESFGKIFRLGLTVFLIIALEVGGLYVLIRFGSQNLSESVASRIGNPVSEAAGNARLFLLPELLSGIQKNPIFGEGFGQMVSYKSYLPDRIGPQNPEGVIQSYAFEWGYLDIWLKIGLLGLLIYLFFIAGIFRKGWERLGDETSGRTFLGMLCALVALLVLNLTTPYLNHPLGIGYLLLAFVSFTIYE